MKPYRSAIILGLGASGRAAADLLSREGCAVVVVDQAPAVESDPALTSLRDAGVRILAGASNLPEEPFDVAVVSPGFGLSHPWLQRLSRARTRMISELELGWSRCTSSVLAVTGSNGKSTVVLWLTESLRRAGYSVEPAGNYGPPLSSVVLHGGGPDWVVVEVSSFQLETVELFRPDVGVLLNCYPNHLDRHGDMKNYLRTKARLFAATNPADTCMVSHRLLEQVRGALEGQGSWQSFGDDPGAGYRLVGNQIIRPGRAPVTLTGRAAGASLRMNAAAVVAALDACGVDSGLAVGAAESLTLLPHRLQTVGCVGGVTFIDDSKATNLAATAAAVRAQDQRVRLIVGGRLKEPELDGLKEVLAEKVSGVYLIGESSDAMCKAWSHEVCCRTCGTMDRAVREAFADAEHREVVLLSPGCASFDQYRSFGERGEHFTKLVHQLAEEETECAGSHQGSY